MLGRLCQEYTPLPDQSWDVGLSKEDFWFYKSSVQRPKKQAIVAILKTQEQIQPLATLLT